MHYHADGWKEKEINLLFRRMASILQSLKSHQIWDWDQILQSAILTPFRSLKMERAFQTGLSPAQHLFAKTTAKLLKTLGPFFERIQAKDFYYNKTLF